MKRENLTPAKSYLKQKLKNNSLKTLFDEEKAKTDIARMIRTAREKEGLTQQELAAKAQTTQAVVSRLEIGSDQRMPSLSLIYRLLQAANAQLELRCVFN